MVEDFFNGQYEVKKFLGEGSFAEVYLVQHVFLDDLRAMKIIKQPLENYSDNKQVFHEVMLATHLRHENIISIYDAGIISQDSNENRAYFVMEYVPGGDLQQYLNSFINSNILMSLHRCLNLMKQILQGLDVLHSSNPVIIHRDLKLNNILLSYNACGDIVIKISDFGFAKEVTTDISDIDVAGTRPYMAPECFKRVVSTETDIYAIGVIFYQLLTNNYPYDIDEFSLEELIDGKPWNVSLKAPSEYNSKIPQKLDEIVLKSLDLNPKNRYHGASELLEDIESIMGEFSADELAHVKNDYVDEYSQYIINDNLREAFELAKCENRLNEAIELLESEVLEDYDIRQCYGETLRMWKSKRPDVKLISKAFSINLRGENYKLSSNMLREAIAYNPDIGKDYDYYLDLWKIFSDLAKYGNLIKAVISLEDLMESNRKVQDTYANIINTLKTFSLEEIVNESIRLVNLNNLADASNLMEFAVVCDSRLKSKYAYKLSLWKQNMKLHFKTINDVNKNAVDYAIDLGTTDSVISYYNGGKPLIIKNYKTGEDFTPSAVLIDDDNNLQVGESARNAVIDNSRNAISEFKGNMGFPIPFKFEKSSKILFPEELSAEVLKDLRVSVFNQYGVNIEDVVICCPANSNPMKTKAINDAAELAGFKSHTLILEPIAVALAYDLKASHKDEGIWMIYDFGGGTFNVSIIEDNGEEIEKLATEGLDNFGGNTLDWKIVESAFIPKIAGDLNLNDLNLNNQKYIKVFSKLKLFAEKSKKELSISTKADVFISNLFDNYDFTYTLTREEFKEIITPSIKTTFDLCHSLLNENNFSGHNVDKIILVGGSCLSPVVKNLIKEEFDIPLEDSIDPLTVVAKGAAIYAGSLDKSPAENIVNEFSLILNKENDILSGKVFALDKKFSFLGFDIEFSNQNESLKIPLNIDGEFKVKLNDGDYLINIYNGEDILILDEKSPDKITCGEMSIPFFKDNFKLEYGEFTYKKLFKKYIELLKRINYLNQKKAFEDNVTLDYLERILEIAQKDKRALNQASLYLNYIKDGTDESLSEIDFSNLLDNVTNKIDVAKRNNLFDICGLDDEVNLAIENMDIDILHEVHSQLIEKYVTLNREEVIKNLFFNLIYEGMYSDYPDELIKEALGAINESDYDLLFDIVKKLYERDERNSSFDEIKNFG